VKTAPARVGEISRRTRETRVEVRLDLDGRGRSRIDTGIGFLDHMLATLATHAGFDLRLRCRGDLEVDAHHSVEDVGIGLGDALRAALGDKRGIERFGEAHVPLDEALARAVVDLSGRGYLHFEAVFRARQLGSMPTELVEDFFRAFATHSRLALHLDAIRGRNAHHIAESLFKATARALGAAVRRVPGSTRVASTKGAL
jgi:imidazoleglycerol-phosphate dehydratase